MKTNASLSRSNLRLSVRSFTYLQAKIQKKHFLLSKCPLVYFIYSFHIIYVHVNLLIIVRLSKCSRFMQKKHMKYNYLAVYLSSQKEKIP